MDRKILRVMKGGIWTTVQGEGQYAGMPSIFLRLAGCNLRCGWCDTPASLPDYSPNLKVFTKEPTDKAIGIDVGEIARLIQHEREKFGCTHLVVTGGEPMLQQEALLLLFELICGYIGAITVETNCEVIPTPHWCWAPVTASLSPKISRYSAPDTMIPAVCKMWDQVTEYRQFKVVVSNEGEVDRAIAMLSAISSPREWQAVQIESSWLREGWAPKETRARLISRAARNGIRIVAQMHPVLRVP